MSKSKRVDMDNEVFRMYYYEAMRNCDISRKLGIGTNRISYILSKNKEVYEPSKEFRDNIAKYMINTKPKRSFEYIRVRFYIHNTDEEIQSWIDEYKEENTSQLLLTSSSEIRCSIYKEKYEGLLDEYNNIKKELCIMAKLCSGIQDSIEALIGDGGCNRYQDKSETTE